MRAAVPVRVAPGRYTFSVFLRSSAPVAGKLTFLDRGVGEYQTGTVLASRNVEIGRGWQRFRVPFDVTVTRDLYWEISATSDSPGSLWLDALQLGAPTDAPYLPATPVEATLASDRLGHIYTSGTQPVLRLRAYSQQPRESQSFVVTTYGSDGLEVSRTAIALALPGTAPAETDVPVTVPGNGIYRSVLSLAGQPEASEVTFSVLPQPRPVSAAQSAFGAALTIAPRPLAMLRRLGFRWIVNLTSNGHLVYWSEVEPTEGEFRWQDAAVALARQRGYELMFNLEPCRVPQWAAGLPAQQLREKWLHYVGEMVRHYRDSVRYWTIGDEVHHAREANSELQRCWRSAEEYALWHEAGYRAIKSVDPTATVILNADDTYAREVFTHIPASTADVLAMNAYHAPKYLVRMKQVAAQHGVQRLWAPGVGLISQSLYAPHVPPEERAQINPYHWRDRARQLTRAVVETLGLGYERLFHYTATFVGNTNKFSLFEADSGLKAVGAQFATLIWFLDGSHSAAEIPSPRLEPAIRAFRFDRNDGNTVFAVWGTLPSERQQLHLAGLALPGIEVFDAFANRVQPLQISDGIELALGGDTWFIVIPATGADEVQRALSGARMVLTELPAAERTQLAGRYAVLQGVQHEGVYRPSPNLSLWYRSATQGWVEVFRNRASTIQPAWRLQPNGLEITWNFDPPPGAFFLEPGMFPTDLLLGAEFYRSRPTVNPGSMEWQYGLVNRGEGHILIQDLETFTWPTTTASLPSYVLNLNDGLRLRLTTSVESNMLTADTQRVRWGGWDFLVWDNREAFLHNYYPSADAPMQLRVKLIVDDTRR